MYPEVPPPLMFTSFLALNKVAFFLSASLFLVYFSNTLVCLSITPSFLKLGAFLRHCLLPSFWDERYNIIYNRYVFITYQVLIYHILYKLSSLAQFTTILTITFVF